MRDWPELPLGEIYHFGSGLSKPADQFGFGYPFLTFREVFNNYFVPKELTSLVNATEKERRSCSIKRGDAFLTRTSETDDDLGMSCVALKDYPDATFNGFTKRLRPNGRVEIHPEFAGYFFRTKRFQAEIAGMSSVTTRASLNNDMLSQLRMLVPPIDEQRAIAEILSSLDDKIDLLHRQSKTLERLAETLFRRWFIEEAKPDWPTKRIRDLAEINTLSVDRNFEHDEIKYLDTGSITESVVAGYELLSLSEAPSRARRLVKQNSIIYSLVRPIQRHFGILKNPKPNTVVSTGFAVIDATKIDPHFLYLFLTQDEMTEYLDSVAEGSTSAYPSLKASDLAGLEIRVPPALKMTPFSELAAASWEKKESNSRQIAHLRGLRDSLLPKLMIGEVYL